MYPVIQPAELDMLIAQFDEQRLLTNTLSVNCGTSMEQNLGLTNRPIRLFKLFLHGTLTRQRARVFRKSLSSDD
jgi:hypothetical protein